MSSDDSPSVEFRLLKRRRAANIEKEISVKVPQLPSRIKSMQRISDSTISLGNDYNQPYASSYSAMTRENIEYSKPEIVRKSGKSDIFHQMPMSDSPRKTVTDRNASTVFSSDPIPSTRPGRKRSTYEVSDIFYNSQASKHYEAAPSAEAYYEPASYVPSSGPRAKADFTAEAPRSSISDGKVASGYATKLASLAAFEEKLNTNAGNQLSQQNHANIFSDHVDSAPSRGRRHYNSISAPTDIFNVSKREEISRSRRDIPLLPEWKAGTSFSNLFGGSVDSLLQDSSRPIRNRMEPSNISRPSGLSSEDLNRDRIVPKGRSERAQDQFRSQIWF